MPLYFKYDAAGTLLASTGPTQADLNMDTLRAQAAAAIATNTTAYTANPATVTALQVAQQVQRLSQQNNALIRIVLSLLDATT